MTQQRPATAARYKRYPAYRDSGVEWLGEIPAHWETSRLKNVARLIDERVNADVAPGSYVALEHVESQTGRLLNDSLETIAPSETIVSRFQRGDVLFGKLRPYLAKVVEAPFAGVCSTEFAVCRGTQIIPGYLAPMLRSAGFIGWVTGMTYGTKMPRVNVEMLAGQIVPLPTAHEQLAIRSFVDHQTTKIDALIAKKERLLELLNERREAIVAKVVTKGLDPTVRMKESGLPSFGLVPTHWAITRLKYVCERVFVGIAEAATFAYVNEGVPLLRSTDVRPNRIRTDDIRYIARGFADTLPSKRLKCGDIVTVRTGNAGVSAVVPAEYDGGQCFTLVVSRTRATNDSRYLCRCLNAPAVQQQFAVEGVGTAQVNISVPIVQNIDVCVPPDAEQRNTADWIEGQARGWTRLADATQEGLRHLHSLRSALISAAVTGKIDVREEVA